MSRFRTFPNGHIYILRSGKSVTMKIKVIGVKFGLNQELYEKIMEIAKNNKKYKFKIFGSRARGDYKETSDIDIAVFKNVNRKDKFKIMNEIDLIDTIYKIDLVFVDKNINKDFLNEIQKEGKDII